MDGKEIRIKSLEFALSYIEYEREANKGGIKYFTATGVIEIAQKMEDYINNG